MVRARGFKPRRVHWGVTMSQSTEQVHFTVDGAGFTELVRNILLGERPDVAWRMAARGLVGDGSEAVARGLLDGTLRLVNVSKDTVTAAPDADEDYQRDLRYIYAGRRRDADGTWWRPAAVVLGASAAARRAAAEKADTEQPSPGAALREWARLVAEYYADGHERVRLVGGRWTIWEPCGERPFWWDSPSTWQAAWSEAEAAKRAIEERGAADSRVLIHELAREGDADWVHEVFAHAEAERRAIWHWELGEQVRAQAGDDTFELVVEASGDGPERRLTVPRAPFWHWALASTKLAHLAPPWEVVSPVGLKLTFDDPYHSDWMLGAGLDLREDYSAFGSEPVSDAAMDARFELQRRLGSYEVAVLADGGEVTGVVGKDVAVLPTLGPEHAEVAMVSRAIIAERGGALAHLAVVGRELGLTIVRDRDAVFRYPKGCVVTINPSNGTVRIQQ